MKDVCMKWEYIAPYAEISEVSSELGFCNSPGTKNPLAPWEDGSVVEGDI